MHELIDISSALADENRLRALLALRGGELCVCQLIELLGLAPSTVSKHMQILRQARMVEIRREGRWSYYRLAGPGSPLAAREAMEWVLRSAGESDRARADVRRLDQITQESPEDLCRRQMNRNNKSADVQTSGESSACCSSAPETPAAAKWQKDGLAT